MSPGRPGDAANRLDERSKVPEDDLREHTTGQDSHAAPVGNPIRRGVRNQPRGTSYATTYPGLNQINARGAMHPDLERVCRIAAPYRRAAWLPFPDRGPVPNDLSTRSNRLVTPSAAYRSAHITSKACTPDSIVE